VFGHADAIGPAVSLEGYPRYSPQWGVGLPEQKKVAPPTPVRREPSDRARQVMTRPGTPPYPKTAAGSSRAVSGGPRVEPSGAFVHPLAVSSDMHDSGGRYSLLVLRCFMIQKNIQMCLNPSVACQQFIHDFNRQQIPDFLYIFVGADRIFHWFHSKARVKGGWLDTSVCSDYAGFATTNLNHAKPGHFPCLVWLT
jgi:hypothetical protein